MEKTPLIIMGCGYTGTHLTEITTTPYSTLNSSAYNADNEDPLPSGFPWEDATVIYSIPPNESGTKDERVTHFLQALPSPPPKIIYLSTSGVYGDAQGRWIDESFPNNPSSPPHLRRISAESQLSTYAKKHQLGLDILRVSGIYGPNRIPVEKIKDQHPIVTSSEANMLNLIHVHDLASIIDALAQLPSKSVEVYNVSDGNPIPTTYYYLQLAELLNLPAPPQRPKDEVIARSSPRARQFLLASKKLDNRKILKTLPYFKFTFPTARIGLTQAIQTDLTVKTLMH